MGVLNLHFIEREVTKLIKKHKTRDPFDICFEKNIECKFLDMHPEINGIYQYVDRTKHIYINRNLPKDVQAYTCCHELGHAVMHEKYNCTFLNTSRLENEAEIFTSCFLIEDVSAVLKLGGLSLDEISLELNVPKKYLKLRLQYGKVLDF
jgi:Zn-dependent peptidase ImmA (M78 family)